jgi:hypothetical protein
VRATAILFALACLAGCAGGRAAAPRPAHLDDGAIAAWQSAPGAGRPAATRFAGVAERSASVDRFEVRRIGGDLPARRVRRRPVDVAFHGADLPNALRLLADAAGLQLVIAEGVAGTISARFTDVDPVEALLFLAQAHGASVDLRGRFAVVTVERGGREAAGDPAAMEGASETP